MNRIEARERYTAVAAGIAAVAAAAMLWGVADRSGLVLWVGGFIVIELVGARHVSSTTTERRLRSAFLFLTGAWAGALIFFGQPASTTAMALTLGALAFGLVIVVVSAPDDLEESTATIAGVWVSALAGIIATQSANVVLLIGLVTMACLVAGLGATLNHLRETESTALADRNAELIGDLRFRADHDHHTGLLNRSATMAQVSRLCEAGEPFALAIVDLDDFKYVNDTVGVQAGDAYLVELASRLTTIAAGRAIVGRIEGGRFGVISRAQDHDVEQLTASIHREAAAATPVGQRPVRCSIGVVDVRPDEGQTPEEIERSARAAVAFVQMQGGGSTYRFDDSLAAAVQAEESVRASLAEALESGEIVAYVQPVVDLHTGQIVGGEALARWIRDGEEVPAYEFIDVAKRARLLNEIDQAVHADIARWRRARPEFAPAQVCINVGPDRLRVAEKGLAGDGGSADLTGLIIEITERGIIADPEVATRQLEQWRGRGARIFLDDFGTGFSSLDLLTSLPIDGLKIDRKFVQGASADRAARAVVAATVELARRLELSLVAEGVETIDEALLMRDMGVGRAQGWLFEKAVPLAEFSAMLEAATNWTELLNSTGRRLERSAPTSVAVSASEGLDLTA